MAVHVKLAILSYQYMLMGRCVKIYQSWRDFRGFCTYLQICVAQFPKGFKKAELPSGKGYLRLTPQPDIA